MAFGGGQNLVQVFSFFLLAFQKIIIFSAVKMRFFNKTRRTDPPPPKKKGFESKLGPTMLRKRLGPSFDSTFLTLFGLFSFSTHAETTIFAVFSSKICIFMPTPKLGTPFVNTSLLTEKMSVLSAFFFCVFVVSVFGRFFRGMKNKNNTIQNKTTKKETRLQNANNKTT